jgi:three-Cys-motif partner protein
MASEHQFGGNWTEEKLDSVRKYLHAYGQIFEKNVKASWYRTIYVDAFAGTGYRTNPKRHRAAANPLFNDKDAISFQKGSAIAALEAEPSFDEYVFAELSENYASELEKLRLKFPGKANKIHVVQREANAFLQSWCAKINWHNTRAVVFLDPYGMQVDWKTIEAMGKTQGVDVWILFPLGQAVNRLLTRNRIPEGAWAYRLTGFFGTDEWKSSFYRPQRQLTLFGPSGNFEKMADFASIGKFFIYRLETVFAKVAKNPRPLYNTRNVPIFLLCFAAANPKGAPTAVKIAQSILGK